MAYIVPPKWWHELYDDLAHGHNELSQTYSGLNGTDTPNVVSFVVPVFWGSVPPHSREPTALKNSLRRCDGTHRKVKAKSDTYAK